MEKPWLDLHSENKRHTSPHKWATERLWMKLTVRILEWTFHFYHSRLSYNMRFTDADFSNVGSHRIFWFNYLNKVLLLCLLELLGFIFVTFRPWTSYQIRKFASYACTGNAGTFSPPTTSKETRVSHNGIHHGTCVTHVPWCMSGSLTRGGGENIPGIPGACATRNVTYLIRGPFSFSLPTVIPAFT